MNNRMPPRTLFQRAVFSTLIASAFTCLGMAPATASTITFESLLPSAHDSGVTLDEAGYSMLLVEGPVAAYLGLVGATGTVVNGGDPFSCDVAVCPSGNSSNYLTVLNDGAVTLTRANHNGFFTLLGLDFAFVTPAPVVDGNYGLLQLAGITSDGHSVSTALNFPGQDGDGTFTFGSATLDPAFRALVFSSLTINACLFIEPGTCSNSVDSPAFNEAQFALDNILLGEVPEPASILLAGMGVAALGWSRRRARPLAGLSRFAVTSLKGA